MLSSLKLTASRLGSQTQTIIRSKHSKTQIKRIFKNNPAFLRVASRNNTLPKKLVSQPPAATYEAFFNPTILPNGWSSIPSEDDDEVLRKRSELPFGIKRTGNKPNNAVGFLPVYSSVRLGGTKHTTIIKKITGDKQIFLNELRAVLGLGVDDQESIRVRASGATIEVNGNRVREVKHWLAGFGF
jgi:hypothetical protein